MKDWNVNIYRGILTGFNEAFIIDENKRNELVASDPKSVEFIRPILRGMDIKKYKVDFAGKWLINTHNGVRQNDIKPIDVPRYPSVLAYLNTYRAILEKRLDKGDSWYNLRSCAYIFEFEKQKIVWQELSRTGSAFCFVEEPMYLSNTAYALTGLDKMGLLYLTSVLNNYTSLFYLEIVYSKLDDTGWRWLKNAVEKIPIPLETNSEKFSKQVQLIQDLKSRGNNSAMEEKSLRNYVYELYNLDMNEIEFLENKYSKTSR